MSINPPAPGVGRENPPDPDQQRVTVSIVVPCRNEADHIETFLQNVICQKTDETCSIEEIIIADGLSDDGTRERIEAYAKNHPRIILIRNDKRIIPTALNEAIRRSTGQIIVRMDVHAEYACDYVLNCVKVLLAGGAQNVGGPARTKAKGYMQEAISRAYNSWFSNGGARYHDIDYEGFADTVPFGCWRRETLFQLGLYDEEMPSGEDDELSWRLLQSGGKIKQSASIILWYYPRPSLRALFRQYSQYGYWKVKLFKKHGTLPSWRHPIPALFVLGLICLAGLSLIHPLFRWSLVAVLVLYWAVLLMISVRTCASELEYLPVMPFVFAIYHLAYGYGFLRGIVDFLILNRRGAATFARFTRQSAK
jgi:succinoglycan biosynthesis protein ExoA